MNKYIPPSKNKKTNKKSSIFHRNVKPNSNGVLPSWSRGSTTAWCWRRSKAISGEECWAAQCKGVRFCSSRARTLALLRKRCSRSPFYFLFNKKKWLIIIFRWCCKTVFFYKLSSAGRQMKSCLTSCIWLVHRASPVEQQTNWFATKDPLHSITGLW